VALRPFVTALLLVPATLFSQQQTPARAAVAGANAQPVSDSVTFRALQWRLVGPFRGGRANAVTGVTSKPFVYYAGYTGGGVWKTEKAAPRGATSPTRFSAQARSARSRWPSRTLT
jgi:hypothetical protein